MSLAEYYRCLQELEKDRAEIRNANLTAAFQRNAVIGVLKAEAHSRQAASSAAALALQARAGRFDEYGEPVVWIDGHSMNMTVSQYARYLEDLAYARAKNAKVSISRKLTR